MTPTETLLPRLEGVKPTGHDKWIARCPAHDDKRPSLSIKVGDTGAVLMHCWAGCTLPAITAAAGISVVDLFPPKCESESEWDEKQRRWKKWKPWRQGIQNGLAPLVVKFQHDLLIVHVLLADIAEAKPISDINRATAKGAAERVWRALEDAQHVL